MKTIGIFVSVVAALVAHELGAAVYSVVAENGDLAAPGTWKDSLLPGETNEVTITKWNSTYTLSKDMTFGSLYVNAGNVMFDFREGDPTLTLTTPIKPWGVETLFRYPERTSGSLWVKLCGGTWDCSGKRFDIVNLGFAGYYTFILTNGCHLSNVDRSYLFRRISNARIYVTDKSKITANKLDYGDGLVGTNDIIEVSGGSEISIDGSFVGQSEKK